jgi:hypothetical protein
LVAISIFVILFFSHDLGPKVTWAPSRPERLYWQGSMHVSMCSRLQGFDATSRQTKVSLYFGTAQYSMQSFIPQNEGTLHAATRVQSAWQRPIGLDDVEVEGAAASARAASALVVGAAAEANAGTGSTGADGLAATDGAGGDSGVMCELPVALGVGSARVHCTAQALARTSQAVR